MGLEAPVNFIDDLDAANPLPADGLNQADDHLRNIKFAIKATFPGSGGVGFNRAIVATEDEIDLMAGCTSSTAELNQLTGRTLTSTDDKIDNFPAGTLMTFQQTAAPTGWTKQVVHNNKAFRVVSGTAGNGGATAFTSIFGSGKITGSHILALSEIPFHDHGGGSHSHTYQSYRSAGDSGVNGPLWASGLTGVLYTTNLSGNIITGQGGGGGHTHTLSLDLQYVDLIIASKD